jgi:hypothetical protein
MNEGFEEERKGSVMERGEEKKEDSESEERKERSLEEEEDFVDGSFSS